MTSLYNLSIYIYYILIRFSSLFGNTKAKLWLKGREDIFERIDAALKPLEKRIWIHASSLGEFEQGRPVIEKLKELRPDYKIVLTFFSPSGYEIRKDYKGADYIFYLPLDTRQNAHKFLDLVRPEKVIFVKYEFWYNYLTTLSAKHIPLYLISANFRKNQHFFKWYGGWFRQLLGNFEHIFVQNESSAALLKSIRLSNITIAGDTRFDRVYSIASASRELPEVKNFVNGAFCIVAGSTWQPDEDLLFRYLNETSHSLKMIVAPHEIKDSAIEAMIRKINRKTVRFSRLQNPEKADVLIIDNIGMLSSLYRYGNVAYIGGGFGKGIHNILEAATFGLPVLFGPNYHKFQEAVNLEKEGGAFPVNNYDNLKLTLDEFIGNPAKTKTTSAISRDFVENNLGATNNILQILLR